MTILVLSNEDVRIGSRIRRPALALAQAGHCILICSPLDFPIDETLTHQNIIWWRVLPRRSLTKRLLFLIPDAIRVLSAIGELKVDAVHCHDPDNLLLGFALSRLRPMKIIYDIHEYWPDAVSRRENGVWRTLKRLASIHLSVLIEKTIMPYCRGILVVNDEILQRYRASYRVPPLALVIENRMRRYPFQPDRRAIEKFPTAGRFVFVYAGALLLQRGLHLVVQAMKGLPQACLIMVGSGPDEAVLKNLVEREHLTDRVFFHPYIYSEADFVHMLSAADCALSPTLPDLESYRVSLANKFFAALMARVPVLAGESRVEMDLLKRHGIGLPLSMASVETVRDSMLSMIENRPARQKMRENMEAVSWDLSWDAQEKQLLEFFKSLEPQ